MDARSPWAGQDQVEAFGRRHETSLVTLLFTDIVGSTALKQQLGDRAAADLFHAHHELVRRTLTEFPHGEEIETAGDSFLLLFTTPSDASQFALLLQARLRRLQETAGTKPLDRIGIHLGEVLVEPQAKDRSKDLFGLQVDTCARVMALANGGQVLMTRAVFDSARQVLKGEDISALRSLEWLSHGPYRLKGLAEPVEICEVREAGQPTEGPPASSEKAERQISAAGEPVLGWRPAVGQVVPGTPWTLEGKLGEGGFGEVWVGRHQTMKERRVFKFCFRADRVRFLKREMTLFRVLQERVGEHPNIVRLLDVYFDQPPFYVEMDYVPGKDLKTWADEQGGLKTIPLEVRLWIVAQIAEALHTAHAAGVIHRDIKPTNILICDAGSPPEARLKPQPPSRPSDQSLKSKIQNAKSITAKLTDFGIGQVVSDECLAGVTRAGFTQTMLTGPSSSSQTGTQLYMAPELLAGEPASPASDLYSLGVVLFQLITGDLRRPLTTDWAQSVNDPLLREDLRRCFAGQPSDRFTDARELGQRLRTLPERQQLLQQEQAAADARQQSKHRRKILTLAGAGALAVALCWSTVHLARESGHVRWARQQALPEIERLVRSDEVFAAYALAREAERYLREDPAFTSLWRQVSTRAVVETTPPGAEVYFKNYAEPDSPWQYLGQSPLHGVQLPRCHLRWRIEKPDYASVYRARNLAESATNKVTLDPVGTLPPGMIRVPGGSSGVLIAGLDHLPWLEVPDFLLDEHEVSNRQYKDFVDGGGYTNSAYWKQPFIKGDKTLTWSEAMAEFRDRTGHAGPAFWKNGSYPEGQADFPVAGVSWYEAAAFAEFAGKRLPSLYHWSRAAEPRDASRILALSNFNLRGPAPVGKFQGISWCGAYDLAGNVKEWCWNEADDGKRYILGGAWPDPMYMFADPNAQSPFARLPTHGFRCIKLVATPPLLSQFDHKVAWASRDFSKEQPVSDETFQIYKTLFSYDKTDLQPRVEARDDTAESWRRETVSFNAAYGNERVIAHLAMPKKFQPPFQVVVIFPGSDTIWERSSEPVARKGMNAMTDAGRAVLLPIYKGTYERGDDCPGDVPTPTSLYRDHVVFWSKDLSRAIDYLETRADIQTNKIAYFGMSWGAALGALLPALEPRIKASILVCGGFYLHFTYPQVDQINFAPRVRTPTLMLNGRYDFYFPVDRSQDYMFRLLGSPPEQKRHVIYDGAHDVPWGIAIQEALDWLDRYLGPVK